MSKMIVYICVVWIAGSRHDGGITRCMWHESQVKYQTVAECKADIEFNRFIKIKNTSGVWRSTRTSVV